MDNEREGKVVYLGRDKIYKEGSVGGAGESMLVDGWLKKKV